MRNLKAIVISLIVIAFFIFLYEFFINDETVRATWQTDLTAEVISQRPGRRIRTIGGR